MKCNNQLYRLHTVRRQEPVMEFVKNYICLMEVTDALIEKLAHLSRLSFNGEEKIAIRQDLEKMIDFISKLNELDTTGIKPTLHMSEEVNVLRNDEIQGSIPTQEALKNAPVHNDQFFLVPRVMKHDS